MSCCLGNLASGCGHRALFQCTSADSPCWKSICSNSVPQEISSNPLLPKCHWGVVVRNRVHDIFSERSMVCPILYFLHGTTRAKQSRSGLALPVLVLCRFVLVLVSVTSLHCGLLWELVSLKPRLDIAFGAFMMEDVVLSITLCLLCASLRKNSYQICWPKETSPGWLWLVFISWALFPLPYGIFPSLVWVIGSSEQVICGSFLTKYLPLTESYLPASNFCFVLTSFSIQFSTVLNLGFLYLYTTDMLGHKILPCGDLHYAL